MIVELVLVVCMQSNGTECATLRQQGLSKGECVSQIRYFENKYGRDPDEPPYLERGSCVELEVDEDG